MMGERGTIYIEYSKAGKYSLGEKGAGNRIVEEGSCKNRNWK